MMELTVLCQNFNALPSAGGLLDQDAETIVKMQIIMAAQQKKFEVDRKKPPKKKL